MHQYPTTFLSMSTLRFRGKCVLSPPTREDAITCLAFSIKGDYVASGGLDRRLHIFALADGKLHYSIVTPSPIKSLIWLPGAEQTLVCACHNGVLINIIIRPAVSGRIPPKSGYCSRIPHPRISCFSIVFGLNFTPLSSWLLMLLPFILRLVTGGMSESGRGTDVVCPCPFFSIFLLTCLYTR